MNAIKRIREYVQAHPDHTSSTILAKLIVALEADENFPVANLYELETAAFQLALELLRDWRIDRYYASRLRMLDFVRHGGPIERELVPQT